MIYRKMRASRPPPLFELQLNASCLTNPARRSQCAFACKGNGLNLDADALKCRIPQLESLHPVMLRLTAQSILSERRVMALPQLP
jgi:hypothetical protein